MPFDSDRLIETLERAWTSPFKTKSDFARLHAPVVCMAQERGLVTTRVGPNVFGDTHLITPKGLEVLWALKGISS
jgi:hypothetical protein